MTAGAFAEHWNDPDFWTSMDKAVQLVEDMASGVLDALSGRYLRAAVDDWRALVAQADEVNAADDMCSGCKPCRTSRQGRGGRVECLRVL